MKSLILLIVFCTILFSCNKEEDYSNVKDLRYSNLQQEIIKTSNLRIYFGHQSVGQNIIDGLEKINKQNGNMLNITENPSDLSEYSTYIFHTKVGENSKPVSKCEDFENQVTNQFKGMFDLAMFKFCYIDFNTEMTTHEIFEHYSKSIKTIQKMNPNLTIVHITSPLTIVEQNFENRIKEVIGRFMNKENQSKVINVKRNMFNDLLREEFKEEIIFDLAFFQSTYPSGKTRQFNYKSRKYHCLIEDYTDDGGHLNELGKKWIAINFINFLATINQE